MSITMATRTNRIALMGLRRIELKLMSNVTVLPQDADFDIDLSPARPARR
jgi:hypothetical protein